MTLPPIRYPLPSLVLVVALGIVAWRGAEWTRAWRVHLAARWERVVEGPPVPTSAAPRVRGGPIIERVLLLHEDVAATGRPGGATVETMHLRNFVDVFDLWPLDSRPGATTHYRIGNRRAIGWVEAKEVLPWNTRLVLRAPTGSLDIADEREPATAKPIVVGTAPLPVLDWSEESLRVAIWNPERPWAEVLRTGSVAMSNVPAPDWGVWLSRDELLVLLRRVLSTGSDDSSAALRLRAIAGRLGESKQWSESVIRAGYAVLPAIVAAQNPADRNTIAESLARINEQWRDEATWSGLGFRMISLSDLP